MQLKGNKNFAGQMELSPDDFITNEEIPQIPQSQRPNVFKQQNQQSNIPDLHSFDNTSSSENRKNIMKEPPISSSQIRDEIIEEKIREDIDSVKKSSSNPVDSSPKNILKRLIAKGDYQETFRLYGDDWTLRALDQRDLLLASEMITNEVGTDAAKISHIIFAQVLFSVEAINGKSVYEFFSDIDPIKFNKREEYVFAITIALKTYFEHMSPQIINEFYDKYQIVDQKRNEALEKLKNS